MNHLSVQLQTVAGRNLRHPRGGWHRDGPAQSERHRWPPSPAARRSADPDLAAQRLARLEAVLLLAREPLTTRKLAKLANLADGTEARTLLDELARRYDRRGCAFQVVRLAGGYQLLTRPQFSRWLRALAPSRDAVQLSDPAMETLAVVAYRQPVLRADVEAVRGVGCGEILRQLMERELLRIVGRSEELGRPFLYGTTKRFLQVFGLRSLDELPRAEQLRARDGVATAAAT